MKKLEAISAIDAIEEKWKNLWKKKCNGNDEY